VLRRERVVRLRCGAHLGAVEGEVELGQVLGAEGLALLLLEHPVQEAQLAVRLGHVGALVQHGVEAALAPLRGRLGIDEQPRRLGGAEPGRVVDALRGRAALETLDRVELELAGGVVAAVADRAAVLEHRLHLGPVVDLPGCDARDRAAARLGLAEAVRPLRSPEGGAAHQTRCQEDACEG